MREIFTYAWKLCLIAVIAALLLGITNLMTAETILRQQKLKADNARTEVMPTADEFKEIETEDDEDYSNIAEIHNASDGGSDVGHVIKLIVKGFGGDIEFFVGIDEEGKITGVKMGKHLETPGLGTKVNDDSFNDQFDDMEDYVIIVKGEAKTVNDVVAISGATITSVAAADAVNAALEYYDKYLEGGDGQ